MGCPISTFLFFTNMILSTASITYFFLGSCWFSVDSYKVLLESSWTRSKKKHWLNLLNFGRHQLLNDLLVNIYSTPIVFFMLQKHRGKSFSFMLSSIASDSLLISDTISKCHSLNFILYLRKKAILEIKAGSS